MTSPNPAIPSVGHSALVNSVVLLGKGDLAIRIGEWFSDSDAWKIVAVVPVMPEPRWTNSLRDWARSKGLPVIESGDYRDLPELSDPRWRADLAFSVFYDRIIRTSFIERCRRILNLHNAPLPKYRGVSPINWALKNGESFHGVTIHEISPGIDDGDIVSQVTFSISPEIDEVIDVYRRCLRFGYDLFLETVPRLNLLRGIPQDNSRASYHSHRDDGKLDDRRYFTRAESVSR